MKFVEIRDARDILTTLGALELYQFVSSEKKRHFLGKALPCLFLWVRAFVWEMMWIEMIEKYTEFAMEAGLLHL